MKWMDVCEDKSLQDLPYKIELNGEGQIVMSPHKPVHSSLQGAIQRLLIQLKPDGYILPELALDTEDGTKAVDVAWVSGLLYEQEASKDAFERAPEICVEVRSPGNSFANLEAKKKLYLERGASEVWICDESGEMTFFGVEGRLDASRLCPGFPAKVYARRG